MEYNFKYEPSIMNNVIIIKETNYGFAETAYKPGAISSLFGNTWEKELKKAQDRLIDRIKCENEVDAERERVVRSVVKAWTGWGS